MIERRLQCDAKSDSMLRWGIPSSLVHSERRRVSFKHENKQFFHETKVEQQNENNISVTNL